LIQRPYENGNDLAYYRELYETDRESKIDSLKELRPKYSTKAGRVVYGGGGITPDVYIPYKNTMNVETGKVLRNPKRPIFNFASEFASTRPNEFHSFIKFRDTWEVSEKLFDDFLVHLEKDSIDVIQDSLRTNSNFIDNRIKSQIAGAIWGKDEAANIRLQLDNQIIETLKHFNEADAFLESSN
jgi:carboxyl-terminal processing protease